MSNGDLPAFAPLEALDSLIAGLLQQASPVEFRITQSASERQTAYRLRYNALIERGVMAPDDFPDGLEVDAHDEQAIHIVGWKDDMPVAAARIVFPTSSRLLPIEEAFHLHVEPRSQVVEFGRFAVVREFAQQESRYFGAMIGFSWREMRTRGYGHICGAISPAMLRHYARLGFVVHKLGPSQVYYGEQRFPCCFDIVASMIGLVEKWGAKYSVTSNASR